MDFGCEWLNCRSPGLVTAWAEKRPFGRSNDDMMAVVVMMMVLHWTGELGRRRIASSSDTYRARHARKGVQIERSAESLESELKTRTFPPAPAHVVRTNPPPAPSSRETICRRLRTWALSHSLQGTEPVNRCLHTYRDSAQRQRLPPDPMKPTTALCGCRYICTERCST